MIKKSFTNNVLIKRKGTTGPHLSFPNFFFSEYFYDALPHCGTGGCAKVMSDAVKNKLVSHERGNMFLAGLAMAANPTKDTIAHVLELCEHHAGRTAMLTLGTLIHKVCESSPVQCTQQVSLCWI